MTKRMTGHLDEERIIAAVVDEQGLNFAARRHLAECTDCRARRQAIEGDLARFGKLSRENAPLPLKRPRIADTGARWLRPAWRLRPSIGMGLLAASLLAFLLSPYLHQYLGRGKGVAMEKIYLEMLQDERFIAEIKTLEEDPFPRFYVDISDFSDQDVPDDQPQHQDSRQPNVKDGKTT